MVGSSSVTPFEFGLDFIPSIITCDFFTALPSLLSSLGDKETTQVHLLPVCGLVADAQYPVTTEGVRSERIGHLS